MEIEFKILTSTWEKIYSFYARYLVVYLKSKEAVLGVIIVLDVGLKRRKSLIYTFLCRFIPITSNFIILIESFLLTPDRILYIKSLKCGP